MVKTDWFFTLIIFFSLTNFVLGEFWCFLLNFQQFLFAFLASQSREDKWSDDFSPHINDDVSNIIRKLTSDDDIEPSGTRFQRSSKTENPKALAIAEGYWLVPSIQTAPGIEKKPKLNERKKRETNSDNTSLPRNVVDKLIEEELIVKGDSDIWLDSIGRASLIEGSTTDCKCFQSQIFFCLKVKTHSMSHCVINFDFELFSRKRNEIEIYTDDIFSP